MQIPTLPLAELTVVINKLKVVCLFKRVRGHCKGTRWVADCFAELTHTVCGCPLVSARPTHQAHTVTPIWTVSKRLPRSSQHLLCAHCGPALTALTQPVSDSYS